MDNLQTSYARTEVIHAPHVREAVGVFSNADALHSAVVELDRHFPRHAISVLGGKKEIERKFGQPTIAPALADITADMPSQAPVRDEEKVIGISAFIGGSAYVGAAALALALGAATVPATILAVVIGGGSGAAISGILVKILGDHYHKDIEDQIEKGGLLLWVNTPTIEQELIACDIMARCGARHVKIIAHDAVSVD